MLGRSYRDKTIASTFKSLSADCRYIRRAYWRVLANEETGGVGDDEILSMAAASRMGRGDTMNYNLKSFPHAKWVKHLAYGLLKAQPK